MKASFEFSLLKKILTFALILLHLFSSLGPMLGCFCFVFSRCQLYQTHPSHPIGSVIKIKRLLKSKNHALNIYCLKFEFVLLFKRVYAWKFFRHFFPAAPGCLRTLLYNICGGNIIVVISLLSLYESVNTVK